MLSSSQKGSVFRTFCGLYTIYIKAGDCYVKIDINGYDNSYNALPIRMEMGR